MCQRSCRQCPATGDCKDAFPRCYSFVRLRGCRHRRVKRRYLDKEKRRVNLWAMIIEEDPRQEIIT